MFNQPKNPIIIDDLVFLNVDLSTLKAQSAAVGSFYFNSLVENAQSSDTNDNVERFLRLNDIYVYMFNKGYLDGNDYNIMFNYCEVCEDDVPNNEELVHAFTLNLTELNKQTNLKRELEEHFDKESYGKYISMLFNPPRSRRCSCCGAYCLSLDMSVKNKVQYAKIGKPLCISCNGLVNNGAEGYAIAYELKHNGQLSANMLKENSLKTHYGYAMEFDKYAGVEILRLLDRFKKSNALEDSKSNAKVKEISRLIEAKGIYEWDVFDTEQYGIVLWNRKKLLKTTNVYFALEIDYKNNQIINITNMDNVIYIGDSVDQFIEEQSTNS